MLINLTCFYSYPVCIMYTLYCFQIPVYLSDDLRHLLLLHYPTRLLKNDQLLTSNVTQVGFSNASVVIIKILHGWLCYLHVFFHSVGLKQNVKSWKYLMLLIPI